MRYILLMSLVFLVSCGGPAKKAENENAAKTELENVNIKLTTLELAVDGMTCTGCEQIVEKTVAALPGVASVEASHTEKKASIQFEEGKVAKAQIEKAIVDAGYVIIKE